MSILFVLLATIGVIGALGTVLARNLIHAALFLVSFFFVVACQFLLLEAEFLAAIQVLIYIGAVAILLLFGIMLTRNIQGDETTSGTWLTKLPAALAAIAVMVVLVAGIVNAGRVGNRPAWSELQVRPDLSAGTDTRSEAVQTGMAGQVGIEMMTRFLIPFEVAGLLLTAAVVGAVALASPELEAEQTPPPSRKTVAGNPPAGPDLTPVAAMTTEPSASLPR